VIPERVGASSVNKSLGRLLVALLALSAVSPIPARAGEPIKLMVPASAGGGWDMTGRAVLAVLEATGLHKAGVQITNKGGAGGTVGLADFVSTMKGDDRAMMIVGATLVGAVITSKPAMTLDALVPLARLTTEHNAIAVSVGSPFKTLGDFTSALKADPGNVPVGGGAVGGVDYITLALIGQAVGAPAARLNYVSYQGGSQVGAVASGRVAAAISGAGAFKPYVDTGRLRLLAVTSDARLAGVSAPTLKESGVKVVIGNWRGLVGPPGMSPAGRASLIDLLDKVRASTAWQETLKAQGWDDAYLSGDAFGAFLREENVRIAAVLKEAGLVK
jgi:putative tricarboxylic transport membrane protein